MHPNVYVKIDKIRNCLYFMKMKSSISANDKIMGVPRRKGWKIMMIMIYNGKK